MVSDDWPKISCERFDGEPASQYERRAKRIRQIITDFRWGRIPADRADAIESELLDLQDPGFLLAARDAA